MKKLILSAAIILGAISVQATTSLKPISTIHSVISQEEFTKITADAVPDAVKSTIEKSFPGAKLQKAYKNEKNEYKLDITISDKMYTIHTDASGNIIKK
jgi:hypothetical protein